jgi:CubicO group peptidase (beta-lactamase class C family)
MGGGFATIDGLLERACAESIVPGVVAMIADRDGVVYEGAAGRLRIGDGPPASTDTMFRIASMTKALTSVAALQLVEQGRLALDQTVASVIPAFGALQLLEGFDGDEPRLRDLSRQATIQHLLTHTSGLSYWFSNVDLKKWHDVTGAPTPLTGLRKCLDTPFVAEPGERWEYGVNTAWLGLVVEAVTDQPLDEYLAQHVFAPLGMTDTTFTPTDAQRERLMAIHNRTPDGGLVPSDIELLEEPELAFGGEGAYGTAGDYVRFLRALLQGGELDGAQILEPETLDLMFTDHLEGVPLPEVMRSAIPELTNDVPSLPFRQGWGLGLHLLLEDVPGMRKAGAGDWAGLFNSYYWIDRATGITAAIFTQLLPFFDARMVDTLLQFEQDVYAQVGAETAA